MLRSQVLIVTLFGAAFCLFDASLGYAQTYDPRRHLAATGPLVREFSHVDAIMRTAMIKHGLLSGAIAIKIDGKLVLREGYGWSNPNLTVVTHPDTLFRLASVSKVLTHSAIEKLIQAGAITRDTPVYPFLKIAPWGGRLGDDRIARITVQQLIDHAGGWKGGGSPQEWNFRTVEVSRAMGLDHPAGPTEVISWVFSKPLDFAPGTDKVYSNFGYLVLGRVIEKASGKPFVDFIQNDLLGATAVNNPLGFKNVILSRSRPRDLDPWETWYTYKRDTLLMPSAVDYPNDVTALDAAGGSYFEAFDAFGGLSASTDGLLNYMQKYWVGGGQRDTGANYRWTYTFFGGLPGAASAIHQDITQIPPQIRGIEFVVLFNGGSITKDKSASDDATDALDAVWQKSMSSGRKPPPDRGEFQWDKDHETLTTQERSITVRIVRSGDTSVPAEVSFATYNKTPFRADYGPRSGVMVFRRGETQQHVTVVFRDHRKALAPDQLLLELLSASDGASLGARRTCIVTSK